MCRCVGSWSEANTFQATQGKKDKKGFTALAFLSLSLSSNFLFHVDKVGSRSV